MNIKNVLELGICVFLWRRAPFPLEARASVIGGFEKDTAEEDLVIREPDSKIVMQQSGDQLARLKPG